MAIRFVIGRAGAGKTHRCFHAIADELRRTPLGPPIYWLLPRQATFSAERDLTCKTGGFCRARVLSFEELGRAVLEDCGGAQVPDITPAGRQMILGHLLRKHEGELKFFKSVAKQPGLAARLDATFSDFERAGADAADLDTLLNQLTGEPCAQTAALLDKIHDLHLIYTRYSEYLGQDRLDQHRRLLEVLKCIETSKLVKGATVYVDGFTEFTEYERKVLARLGKICRLVEITLPMDPRSPLLADPHLIPDALSLFQPAEMTYRRLWFVLSEEKVAVDEPFVLLLDTHRFERQSLRKVEARLFDHDIVIHERDSAGVELLEAPTRRAEVDAAARRIRALAASGYRLRDIAVLVRDLSVYHELIDASFREHGISYFADRRRPTAHHPLLQMVRSLLMLGQRPWDHEWLMTLLKSGLAGVPETDADALENYVLRHRIRGTAWVAAEPWSYETGEITRSEDGPGAEAGETAKLDARRRELVAKLQPFVDAAREKSTVQAVTVALFETLERFGVRTQLAGWIGEAKQAGRWELAEEHQQVWADLADLFQQQVDLLGEEAVTLAGFQEIVEAGLEAFELALTPPTVDQVLVGQADRTRTPALRAVLVLGLNEGVFPKSQREDSVLSDADRRELQTRRLDVNPATDRRLLDENLLAYLCCTSASELLYVSRSIADAAGKPLGESVYFRRLRQMFFPHGGFSRIEREEKNDPAQIATPRQLVTALMRWVRNPAAEPSGPWPALYQWLAGHPCSGDRVDETRFGAWKALSYHNTAALSAQWARKLFPAPLHVDARQLETFASCPFQHFLRHGLRLQPRQADDGVSAMDLGSVFHHVMDRVVRDMLRNHLSWADLPPHRRQALIHEASQEISKQLRGEILLSTPRNRYLLQRVEKTLEQVVANQASIAERGNFRPAFSRVRFGGGGGGALPEFSLKTPAGSELFLRGKIDRIDVLKDGVEFAVVDYKLGGSELSLAEVYHGIALQLLTYLLVLEASGETLAGRKLTPAAAFYVRMLRSLGDVDHPSSALEPDDPKFHLQVKPRGIFDGRLLRHLDTDLQAGDASDVVNARINKDGAPGSKGRSDLADANEFSALLAHVRRRLGELADRVTAGTIGIAPYMLGQETPCPRCEFHGVCRFEPSARGYRILQSMNREKVLKRVSDEQAAKQGEGSDDAR